MSRTLGNTIADSLQLSLGYGERLLAGITPENFGRFASPGGQVVESNHPAFIYGHLSLYACRVVEQLGDDASKIVPSDKFTEVFSKDAECVDDLDGSIYPQMSEVTDAFFDGYRAALESLQNASDETLQQPNPGAGMAERFPTLGSMHGFYVGGHIMIHMGQLSAWRRMAGLGRA